MGGSREPALPWRLSVFRERAECRSAGCPRSRLTAAAHEPKHVRPGFKGTLEKQRGGSCRRARAGVLLPARAPPGAPAASAPWRWVPTPRATMRGGGGTVPAELPADLPPEAPKFPGKLQGTRPQAAASPLHGAAVTAEHQPSRTAPVDGRGHPDRRVLAPLGQGPNDPRRQK